MTWLMEILKIYLEEQLQIKYYVINPKYDGYQRGLASMVYKVFDKKTASGAVKNEIIQNKELAEELCKSVIRKFDKQRVRSSFIDNI